MRGIDQGAFAPFVNNLEEDKPEPHNTLLGTALGSVDGVSDTGSVLMRVCFYSFPKDGMEEETSEKTVANHRLLDRDGAVVHRSNQSVRQSVNQSSRRGFVLETD